MLSVQSVKTQVIALTLAGTVSISGVLGTGMALANSPTSEIVGERSARQEVTRDLRPASRDLAVQIRKLPVPAHLAGINPAMIPGGSGRSSSVVPIEGLDPVGYGPPPLEIIQLDGSCFGHKATLVGTNGDDVLVGTQGNDVILGLEGNDVILGLEGNDILCGGPGEDQLSGGIGDDTVLGEDGHDQLRGEDGHDILFGDCAEPAAPCDGDDYLNGGAGDDKLWGDSGNDYLDGDEGLDYLDGGADIDDCFAGSIYEYCEYTG